MHGATAWIAGCAGGTGCAWTRLEAARRARTLEDWPAALDAARTRDTWRGSAGRWRGTGWRCTVNRTWPGLRHDDATGWRPGWHLGNRRGLSDSSIRRNRSRWSFSRSRDHRGSGAGDHRSRRRCWLGSRGCSGSSNRRPCHHRTRWRGSRDSRACACSRRRRSSSHRRTRDHWSGWRLRSDSRGRRRGGHNDVWRLPRLWNDTARRGRLCSAGRLHGYTGHGWCRGSAGSRRCGRWCACRRTGRRWSLRRGGRRGGRDSRPCHYWSRRGDWPRHWALCLFLPLLDCLQHIAGLGDARPVDLLWAATLTPAGAAAIAAAALKMGAHSLRFVTLKRAGMRLRLGHSHFTKNVQNRPTLDFKLSC